MEHKSNRPRGLNRRGFLAATTSTVTLLAAAKAKAQEIEAQKRGDAAEPLADVPGRRAETELRINGQYIALPPTPEHPCSTLCATT